MPARPAVRRDSRRHGAEEITPVRRNAANLRGLLRLISSRSRRNLQELTNIAPDTKSSRVGGSGLHKAANKSVEVEPKLHDDSFSQEFEIELGQPEKLATPFN